MTETIRKAAWNTYWSTGALHSCVTSLDDQYTGAIGDFWNQLAASLDKGVRILDIATGNGPVPKFLSTKPGAGSWTIRGIDLADIRPAWLNEATDVDVRLYGNCRLSDAAETLALDGQAKFDMLTSQFGWEYVTPRDDAIRQARELTNQGGRWRFVCHHNDSVFVEVAREEVAHVEFLLRDDGLIQSTAGLLPWMERAQRDPEFVSISPQAQSARIRFNNAVADLGERLSTAQTPDLLNETRGAVHQLMLSVSQGVKVHHAAILANWRQSLRDTKLRCQELIDHALSRGDIDTLFASLRAGDAGVATDAVELRQEEGLLAWGIRVDFSA